MKRICCACCLCFLCSCSYKKIVEEMCIRIVLCCLSFYHRTTLYLRGNLYNSRRITRWTSMSILRNSFPCSPGLFLILDPSKSMFLYHLQCALIYFFYECELLHCTSTTPTMKIGFDIIFEPTKIESTVKEDAGIYSFCHWYQIFLIKSWTKRMSYLTIL